MRVVDHRSEQPPLTPPTTTLCCNSTGGDPCRSGLLASTAVCAAIVGPMFDMPLYMPLIAVVFSVFVSILSVRALGETDLAPVSVLNFD